MSTRFAGLLAVAVLILSATSFTAQEPPRPPMDLEPPLALPTPQPAEPTQEDLTMRLEFQAGTDKGDPRIVWKRDGVAIEATRINVGPKETGMELVAVRDGIAVQTYPFSTVCKSIEVRPGWLQANARSLPSAKSSGRLRITRSAPGRATVQCDDFTFECTKLVLAGAKNRLEVNPGPDVLHVKTNDAEIRSVSVSVQYQSGFRLTLEATTTGKGDPVQQSVRLAQQP